MSREGAEDNDGDSNQHCRKHPYSLIAVEVFHKWRLLAISLGVKDKSRLSRLKSAALRSAATDVPFRLIASRGCKCAPGER